MTRLLFAGRLLHRFSTQTSYYNAVFRRATGPGRLPANRIVEVGGLLAMLISGELALERETGRMDLLRMTPLGSVEIALTYAVGVLHRSDGLTANANYVVWMLRWLAFFFGAGLLAPESATVASVYTASPQYVLWFLAITFDRVFSITLGVLTGVVVGTLANEAFIAQVSAIFLFLTLRVTAVGAVIVFGSALPWPPLWIYAAQLGVYIALNEFMVYLLWYAVQHQELR